MRNQSIRLLMAMCAMVCIAVGCKIVGDDTSSDHATGGSHVEVNALPITVTAAVKGLMPTATITDAKKEMYKNKRVYNLDVKDGEKEYDVIVTPDGQIL